jgi:hypothetical protein
MIMAKGDKANKGNGGAATNVEPQAEQRAQEQESSTDLEATSPGAGVEAPQAQAEPQGEPGPEDFERHTLAQLKAGKAADMKRRAELERELADVRDREARRDAVFAPRFLQEAAAKKVENPILEINGIKLVPRAKRGGAGGFITFRERAPLDI